MYKDSWRIEAEVENKRKALDNRKYRKSMLDFAVNKEARESIELRRFVLSIKRNGRVEWRCEDTRKRRQETKKEATNVKYSVL